MKPDPWADGALRASIGAGAFFGLVGVVLLAAGRVGAFFGFAVVGAGLAGLGWAGRRLMALPGEEGNAASTAAGVVFGGAGAVMLIGGAALFVQGELGGAVGLALFGTVFAGVGYAGYRVFRVPEGRKRVLVARREQPVDGTRGEPGRRTTWSYRYVDSDLPDDELEAMQRRWAAEPWTRRADWAEGRVVQEGPASPGLLIGFTIVWNVIAWGIAGLALASEWGGGDVPWWVLVFPLAGVALAVMAVRTWIRRRRYGVSVLALETVPAWSGERLRGAVETGVDAAEAATEGFVVRLRCVERRSYRDRDGDHRVSEEDLWSEERREPWRGSGADGRLRVPVVFDLPPDLPPTEMLPEDDRVLWRLEVSAAMPGVDYAAQFEVPVFRRAS